MRRSDAVPAISIAQPVIDGWTIKRLKWSVANIKNGIWGGDPVGNSDDIKCIRVADFNRETMSVVDVPTTRNVSMSDRKGRVVLPGDLLLEKSGGGEMQPVGVVAMYLGEEAAVCSNFVARVSTAPSANARFFLYVHAALYSSRINVRSIKQTSGIQNLDAYAYLSEFVAYPPIEIQREIASFLDRETAEADVLIAKYERLIELLDEKRVALITRAVTKGLHPNVPMKDSGLVWIGDISSHWTARRLSKCVLSKLCNGFVGPTRDILRSEGVPYLQSLHIKNGRIIFDTPYYVAAEWLRNNPRITLCEGDVVIVQTGDIGQVARINKQFDGVGCHALIIARVDKTVVDSEFLSLVFRSSYGKAALQYYQSGALHPHLTCDDVRDIFIPLPPLGEQRALVQLLEAAESRMERDIDNAARAIALVKEHRSALITAAVTGQIDVTTYRSKTKPLEISA